MGGVARRVSRYITWIEVSAGLHKMCWGTVKVLHA